MVMKNSSDESADLVQEMNQTPAEPFSGAEMLLVGGSLGLGLTLLAILGWFLHR